ncbi:MAG: aspartate--tRNA(Asn) ligase [Candidatus Nealsonbacteria bacterium CG03_land_8_20_14_0_80_36_12]|uniref:Aspartate--tRNA ligase n=1 Tax=Candidatus Nealsonbacteria bacterium CG03_land_8_20_14_0_80_36_12 TaxID=1974701 RepID=A0A2M7BY59_9BACT|nr:MAG: aspartate--tRNA(Asn) ligase [Candidatus Nealsonbacteria bacterium CG03_land_8_20_14_0_80_36_12]
MEKKRTLISDLPKSIDRNVKIQGWVQTIRDQKKMQFLILRDSTGLVQVTHERGNNEQIAQTIAQLIPESAVEVEGKVVANQKVKLGGIEVMLESFRAIGPAKEVLPIDIFGGNLPSSENRLNWRFLDLRRPQNILVFRIQTTIEQAMRSFWQKEGFIEIHSPKLMGTASESGGELFKVEYFDRKAYLAQSPQFYKQMAMTAGFEKVFEIGPVFRANPSFTSRHDTEFTSIDMEMSWIESHEDIMEFEERWLKYVLQAVKEEYGESISSVFGVKVNIPEIPFPRLTMEEALEILLREKGYKPPRETKGDLDPQGERFLTEYINKQFGHEFLFVKDYPISARPFYHMRHQEKPEITKSFDLLWKGLEITTGAQREHRYDILVEQAKEKGLSLQPLQFYLDFFKFGCPPHGGFGFGLTRMLMLLLGLENVREVTFLYRGPNRLTP